MSSAADALWTSPIAGVDAVGVATWDPLGDHTVNQAMTYGVYALPPNTDVGAVADGMRSADVRKPDGNPGYQE